MNKREAPGLPEQPPSWWYPPPAPPLHRDPLIWLIAAGIALVAWALGYEGLGTFVDWLIAAA